MKASLLRKLKTGDLTNQSIKSKKLGILGIRLSLTRTWSLSTRKEKESSLPQKMSLYSSSELRGQELFSKNEAIEGELILIFIFL